MPDSAARAETSRAPETSEAGRRRRRIGRAVAIVGALGMAAIGLVRWARDGSFWLDEASIAVNLLAVASPLELFGPYPTGHSFPRLYLFTIALLERALGYETAVLRALPVLAFVGGVAAWTRLFYVRLRDQPALLALGIVLALVPATGFAYGAMLKQYSLDVLLALLPFLLSDSFYERRLREGRGRVALVWLALPTLLSFTYVVALLGRVVGWWLSGLAFGRRRLDPGAIGVGASALALAAAALYGIDLRHTAEQSAVFAFWGRCIPAEVGVAGTGALLLDLVRGWYTGTPFGARPALPGALAWGVVAAFALGAVEAVRRAVRARAVDSPTLARWGSRSLGALVLLGGLCAASLLVDYPLCRGRLTLFALFAVQLLTLEGFHALSAWGAPTGVRRHAATAVTLLFAALCLPAASRSVHHLVARDVPENVRPLLAHLDEAPELPIVVAECSTRQLASLPEWLDDPRVVYFEERRAKGLPGHPDASEFWVISAGTNFYCPWYLEGLRAQALDVSPRHTPRHTAQLFRVRMPPREHAPRASAPPSGVE